MDPLSKDAHHRSIRARSERVLVRALPAKITMQKAALVFVLFGIGVLVAVRPARGAEHFANCHALQCGR